MASNISFIVVVESGYGLLSKHIGTITLHQEVQMSFVISITLSVIRGVANHYELDISLKNKEESVLNKVLRKTGKYDISKNNS